MSGYKRTLNILMVETRLNEMSRTPRKTGAAAPGVVESDIRQMRAATIPSYMRLCFTPDGPVRLTTTEVQILAFVGRNEGRACSKSQIASAIGRNEKTVSRLISRLRQYQVLEAQPSFAENGAQLANVYRLASGRMAKPEEEAHLAERSRRVDCTREDSPAERPTAHLRG